MTDSDSLEPPVVEAVPVEAADGLTAAQVRKEQRGVLFRSPAFIVGVLIVAFWVFAALFPSILAATDPKEPLRDAADSVLVRQAPSGDAFFGTDRIGRSVWARVIHGARPVLIVAPLAAGIAVAAGTFLGLIIGYYRGWIDEVISRIIEGFLSVPVILLAIIVVFTFGQTTPVIVGTVATLFTPVVARTIRAATMTESQLDYIVAARTRGESGMFIIAREILPNIWNIIIVELTARIGWAIFTVATLAFLALAGDDVTNANWGVDVADNYSQVPNGMWWPTIFPALAIASLVIAVNLIADSIEKATSS